MALADLLGAMGDGNLLGLPPRPAYGGFQFDLPQAAPAAAPQAAPTAAAAHGPSKFRNFLGAIGDALLVAHGQQPLYRQHVEEQKQQSALQGFLTNPDSAIAQLMQVDAPTGIALWKAVHPPSEVPIGIKEYEYARSNGYKGGYEDFVKLTHPAMMAPVTLGPNDTYDPGTGGGASSPPPAAVDYLKSHPDLAPHFDQKYGTGAAARVMGGATASTPSPTFR